ncbi:hypothetical protein LY474_01150 [Myxococcus stipitatus]|uniref:nSTAND1 domain-containing NTPase n=1 Tax=Myxococcus stipitatus TaxID=83455 RepID=UPI001F431677|nr:hypothetical protein [Myxococcus stipitatus]MCE9666405.1 hypothetical protein [Myxococcus stipitatus]
MSHALAPASEVAQSAPQEDPNPFRGPQPYRFADHPRFIGREEDAWKLLHRIRAHPCVTLYGPSGAGKSSLMQAGVLPLLVNQHGFRVVRVDVWPAGEHPLARLLGFMDSELGLGSSPEGLSGREALEVALELATLRSDQPILVYLDQLEQLFLPSRKSSWTDEFIEVLGGLAGGPFRGLQFVLALREDYLGRFRDRLRGRRALLAQGFRLGPLTVKEMTAVACSLAAMGTPAQRWTHEEMRPLMVQMRAAGQLDDHDDAEVQAAFAQIVCRALWEARSRDATATPTQAEPMLHRYLDETLDAFGTDRDAVLRLLEDLFIAKDGSRTLLTQNEVETEARDTLPENVLARLEAAAVLHSEEHQGKPYYELGHDWLARKVRELKEARQTREARERGERELREVAERKLEEQRRALADEREAHATRMAEEKRRQRERRWRFLAVVALVAALALAGVATGAMEVRRRALELLSQAQDSLLVARARELAVRQKEVLAAQLLLEVKGPEQAAGWTQLANELLAIPMPLLTLRSDAPVQDAAFGPVDVMGASPERVVMVSRSKVAWLFNADGTGTPTALEGHRGNVVDAAFSPTEPMVATASEDGDVRLWPTDGTGRAFLVLQGHTAPVQSVRFSADGRWVATASSDGTVCIWNTATGALRVTLRSDSGTLVSARFSADGRRLVTAQLNGLAKVWNLDGSGPPVTLGVPAGIILSAALNSNGTQAVTASNDSLVRLWTVDGAAPPVVLKEHTGIVYSAEFSEDDAWIVTASQDQTVRVWRSADGAPVAVLRGHTDAVRTAYFDRFATAIVSASEDGTARVWRTDLIRQPDATGRASPESRPKDLPSWAWGSSSLVLRAADASLRSARFSADGNWVVTASDDKTARVWRVRSQMAPTALQGHLHPLTQATFSPDGKQVLTASRDRSARVWRTDVQAPPVLLLGHEGAIQSARFSGDGRWVVTASDDLTARVWRADGAGIPVVLSGHSDSVVSARFSPDGTQVVTASLDGTARVWRADGEGPPSILSAHEGAIWFAEFSPDGAWVVTASDDKTARVWDWRTGVVVATFVGHEDAVQTARFSPDGRFVVTASSDGTARVWRVSRPETPVLLSGHEGFVVSAEFSPDGTQVVTASTDGTARVWRADGTGLPVTLTGHNGYVNVASFSQDGRWVLTGSEDRTAWLWRADGGGVPLVFRGHNGAVRAADLSPDGKRVVTGSTDATAQLWSVDVEALRRRLEASNLDCLPSDLRRAHLEESEADALARYADCEVAHGRPRPSD